MLGDYTAVLVDQRALVSSPAQFFRRHLSKQNVLSLLVLRKKQSQAELKSLSQTRNLIGVFHAPVDKEGFIDVLTTELGLARSSTRPSPKSDFVDIEILWKQHSSERDRQLARLHSVLRSPPKKPTGYSIAYREARRLANSLGAFGYYKATQSARTLSHYLANAMAGEPLDPHFQSLLEGLETYSSRSVPGYQVERPQLLVLSQDEAWLLSIREEAEFLGWGLRACRDFGELAELAEIAGLKAILIDLRLSSLGAGASQWLELSRESTPTFFLGPPERLPCSPEVAALSLKSSPYEVMIQVNRVLLQPLEHLRTSVMLWDANPSTAALNQKILQQLDFHVEWVARESQFWSWLEKHRPDLIILPLQAGKLNGYEVIRALRLDPRFFSTAIVLTTEYSDRMTTVKAYEAGADDVLLTPYSPRELRSVVNNRLRLCQERLHLESLSYRPAAAHQTLANLVLQARRRQVFIEFYLLDCAGTSRNDRLALASQLHQLLRSEDVVRLWGEHSLLLATLVCGVGSPRVRLSRFLAEKGLGQQVQTARFPADGDSLEEVLAYLERALNSQSADVVAGDPASLEGLEFPEQVV